MLLKTVIATCALLALPPAERPESPPVHSTLQPAALSVRPGRLTVAGVVVTPSRGQAPSAGYFRLANPGSAPDRLLAARSARVGRIELHTMSRSGGMMMMQALPEGVVIPARGEVEFARGGLHLMLYDAAPRLVAGETISLTLTFERAGDLEVTAVVQ